MDEVHDAMAAKWRTAFESPQLLAMTYLRDWADANKYSVYAKLYAPPALQSAYPTICTYKNFAWMVVSAMNNEHLEACFKRELFDDPLERAYSESKSLCRFDFLKDYILLKAEKLAEAHANELLAVEENVATTQAEYLANAQTKADDGFDSLTEAAVHATDALEVFHAYGQYK